MVWGQMARNMEVASWSFIGPKFLFIFLYTFL